MRRLIVCCLVTVLHPAAAFAQTPATLDSGDTAWMLAAIALVLLMTLPGLALFYGGLVRRKNTLAAFADVFTTACVVTVLWAVIGYSLAFRPGALANDWIGGFDRVMLRGLEKSALVGTIPESVYLIFQMTFAIITPALICGAFADRMRYSALLLFSGLWLLVVYCPVAHWVWGGGYFSRQPVLDYAGGTVVHINSGVAGLVCALVLGRRRGFGVDNLAPHNLTLSVAGASLLWVGWFGFNAGSALAANSSAGMALLVTQLAAAAAALAWMFSEWLAYGKPSVLGIISGAIAGLVAITPASGYVAPDAALIIGTVAGICCFVACTAVKQALRYDDALDVFGIHAVGGIVGTALTGVFASEAIGGTPGLLEGNEAQLWRQLEGIGATVAWSAVGTALVLLICRILTGLRVSQEDERTGLDLSRHGEVVP